RGAKKIQDNPARFRVDRGGKLGLVAKPPMDAGIPGEKGLDGLHNGPKWRCGGRIVQIDVRPLCAVTQRNLGVKANDAGAYLVMPFYIHCVASPPLFKIYYA